MKHPILLTCVLAGVSAAGGAALATLSLAPAEFATESKERPANPTRGATTDARVDELLSQVRALQVANEDLRARISSLEARPLPDSRVLVAESAAQQVVERDSPAALAPHEVHETVAAALEDIRAEEKAAAELEREQREAERIEERLSRMSEQLGLTPAQVADMRALMVSQRDARDELDKRREELGSRDAYRTERDALRKLEEQTLARILTPTQLENYQARDSQRDSQRASQGDDPRGRSNRTSRTRGGGQRNG